MFRVVFPDISAVFCPRLQQVRGKEPHRAGCRMCMQREGDYVETHYWFYQFGQIQMPGGPSEGSCGVMSYLLRLGIL